MTERTPEISAGSWWATAYLCGAIGSLLAIAGGNWDVASHNLGAPETFFTPAHTVLYSGIGVMALAVPVGLIARFRAAQQSRFGTGLTRGIQFVLAGTAVQLFAGGFDFWWHETFGFDAVLFSPPHLTLVVGLTLNTLGVSLGTVRILAGVRRAELRGRLASLRLWMLLALVSFTALWLALNGLVYFFLDVRGIGFTFKLWGEGLRQAVPQSIQFSVFAIQIGLLAITGMGMLTVVRRMLAWRGSSSVLGALAVVVWSAAVGVPFGAYPFLAVYAAMLIPLALLEWRAATFPGRWTAVLLGPVAFALNGWTFFSLFRLLFAFSPIVLWLVPTFLTGVVGLRFGARLSNWLSSGIPQLESPLPPRQ